MIDETDLVVMCPSCESPITVQIDNQYIQCLVCDGEFELRGHLCPACLTYHVESEGVCQNCGNSLVRICRSCLVTNWSGAETCVRCGQPIDIVNTVAESSAQSTADRLNDQMGQAKSLKEKETRDSNKRMAELMAIEEARQAEIRQRLERQKNQERQLLLVVFSAVVIFLLVLIIFALLSSSS